MHLNAVLKKLLPSAMAGSAIDSALMTCDQVVGVTPRGAPSRW